MKTGTGTGTDAKKVLVLGAGLVARPLVRYLLEKGFAVHVATRTVSKADSLVGEHPHGTTSRLDLTQPASLDSLVPRADLVISLVPYAFHCTVAEYCLKHKRQMITTSYVSPAMRALDGRAREAGILILNEIGLDPGIDHMSAMRIIHRVRQLGGQVTGFASYCGGLPAPEANTNPLGYKFSWSPRGVLLAGRNAARFLRDGKEVTVPAAKLFAGYWHVDVAGLGTFEAYPNRDSLPYIEAYGLHNVTDMLRGTLRNAGWCSWMNSVVSLGLLGEDTMEGMQGAGGAAFLRRLMGVGPAADLRKQLATRLGLATNAPEIEKFDWLGFLGETPLSGGDNPLDILVARLWEKLRFAEGERDMIILQHEFRVSYPASGRQERIISTLVDFGIPHGDSAMSRTVSLPAAIAARLILAGEIRETGVHAPVLPHIYEPIMAELADNGIAFKETA